VDGVALAVGSANNASAVRQLRSANVPLVQISRKYPYGEADFVGIDDHGAASAMMRHALDHLLRPLATVVGPRTSSASAAREDGFVTEAQSAGIMINGTHRVSVPLSLQGGRAAAEHLFKLPNPPRFILCGSDILALGVMSHALEVGLRVPEDAAISGFDGIEIASTPMVDLTGIVQPSRALEVLADRIEHNSHTPTSLAIPYTMRIGRTCGCSAKGKHDS